MAMARTGIKNTNMMLITKPLAHMQGMMRINERWMSKYTTRRNTKLNAPPVEDESPASCWVPHPRSGIYFPKGQEWVMEDIPNDAASFDRTFWLRNSSTEGVDHCDHKPDVPADGFGLHNPS